MMSSQINGKITEAFTFSTEQRQREVVDFDQVLIPTPWQCLCNSSDYHTPSEMTLANLAAIFTSYN